MWKNKGHSLWLVIVFTCSLLFLIGGSNASNIEIHKELRFIYQDIDSLRDENQNQNQEIALLREVIGISQSKDEESTVTARTNNHRSKRPVRLLPPHILQGERRNESQYQPNPRRYTQPTGCSDLAILGYTLNGFYLVKSVEPTSNNNTDDPKIDTVFCFFKQPEGTFNMSNVEKRIPRETKAISRLFHATISSDFSVNKASVLFGFPFNVVHFNLGGIYNVKKVEFTVPKSGMYLFVFQTLIDFRNQRKTNGNYGFIFIELNSENAGTFAMPEPQRIYNVKFEQVVRGNRGDTMKVVGYFNQVGAEVYSNSTSLTVHYLEEQI